MLLPVGGVDDHVIEVCYYIWVMGSQHNVHQLLESGGHPMEAKGEYLVLPMSQLGAEGCFWAGFFG